MAYQSSTSMDITDFTPESNIWDPKKQNKQAYQSSATMDITDFTPDSNIMEPKKTEPQPGPSHKDDSSDSEAHYYATDSEVPRRMHPLLLPTPFQELMDSNNIPELKKWIRNHYHMTEWYIYMRDEIEYIISQYMPNFRAGVIDNPTVLIQILKKILPVKERINISPHLKKLLEGSTLVAKVQKHRQWIMETFEGVENEVEALRDHIQLMTSYTWELEAKLKSATDRLRQLEEGYMYDKEAEDDKFMAQMEMKVTESEYLHSTFAEEVDRNKDVIRRLNREVRRLKAQLVEIDHDRIKELAEVAQDIEIDETLKRSVLEKISSLNANTEDCKRALNDWMDAIRSTFAEKKESIESTKKEVKMLDTEVAKQEAEVQDLSRRHYEMQVKIADLRESITEEEVEIQDLEHYVSQLEQQKRHLSIEAEQANVELAGISTSTPSRSQRPMSSPGSPIRFIDSTGGSHIADYTDASNVACYSRGSPERFRGADSPGKWPRNLDDTATLSLDSSGADETPDIRVSGPSPIDLDACQSLYIPSPIAPGTQTISQSRSGLFPSTGKVNPSTQTVTNRIDVGKSLNMQTTHSGLNSPYKQQTRVVSDVPLAGPSRMVDTPFRIKHMADFTPSRFVTPFISTTRFGYTDPKAKVLNLPPGDNYELDTVLKKRLLLTSPQREDPLLVDIGVQPLPLIQTRSGEHFVCDISLDIQQAGKRPYISPVFTFGVPPAVTPTITRRDGQFTPKGIFKKKHFNLRKIIGPDYDSPGKYFPPHYLPFDGRSPISTIPPSPYYSDRSISWEKVPGLDDTYDTSMMNRTFDASPPALNRTFDAPPPALNRTFDAPSPALNRTHGESPPALIQGPTYRWRTQESYSSSEASPYSSPYDRSQSSYLGSPSSRISSPMSDRSLSSRSGGTYDRSMSPRMDGTFDRSSSPKWGGTFDRSMSPRLDGTFDQSSSPRSGGTFDRSMSPRLDATFDRSMSPRLDATFDRSMSPRSGGTYDHSMSPRSGGAYDSSISPRSWGTYDRSMSPRSAGTYDRSMSPGLNATFDRSSSPRSGGTYDRSMSPGLNVTFDHSSSPRSGGTYDRSISPRSDRSMSPRSGGTCNSSMSPRLNATFDRSRSPRSDDTPDSSLSPLNRAFVEDHSYESDRSIERSPSPRLDDTFDSDLLNKSFIGEDSPLFDVSNRSESPRSENGTFPRVDRTHKVSISPRLSRTYNVSYPHLMDRPIVENESPQSNRTFSPQRFNIPFNESDRSSTNRTFDTYSSQYSGSSGEDWSHDSGYTSYASNQSGQSERSP